MRWPSLRRELARQEVIDVLRRRHSAARYWLIDWPVFLIQAAWAWYWTIIGTVGVLLILWSIALVVRWWVAEHFSW